MFSRELLRPFAVAVLEAKTDDDVEVKLVVGTLESPDSVPIPFSVLFLGVRLLDGSSDTESIEFVTTTPSEILSSMPSN